MTGIAIVGQGTMGKAHARAWSELGLGRAIRFVCSRGTFVPMDDAPAAEFTADFDTILRDEDVDIVSICTPTPTHASLAIQALDAGKNVLLEKPAARTLADASAIRAAAVRSSGVLMVAQVVRFFGGYEAVHSVSASGRLGELTSVRAVRLSAPPPRSTWWQDESQSGGMLVDFGIHDFDQANQHLGTPGRVTARRAAADGGVETTIEYTSGGIGQVLSFMGMAPVTPFVSSIDVTGVLGVAAHRFVGAPEVSASRPQGQSIQVVTADGTSLEVADETNPYARQARYFLDCVATGSPATRSDIDSAIAALGVALASRASLMADRPIPVQFTPNHDMIVYD